MRFTAIGIMAMATLLAPAAVHAQAGGVSFLAGNWSAQTVDRFGASRSCRIELSTTSSIFGGLMANASMCPGGLAMVALWRAERGRITLSDMSGTVLARLRQQPGGFAGSSSAGEQVWLSRRGAGFGAGGMTFSGTASRCQLYYGASERCAPSIDFNAPRLAPGERTMVRVIYPANLRVAPSLAARSLGIVPLNTCLAAEACAAAPGGGEWCRMRYGDRTGYMLKAFEREGRRMILFSNRCSPG